MTENGVGGTYFKFEDTKLQIKIVFSEYSESRYLRVQSAFF